MESKEHPSTPDRKIDMADHDVCTILDGESVAALAGTVLPYERTLYRAFYLGFYPDNGPIVLIDVQILCVYKCKPGTAPIALLSRHENWVSSSHFLCLLLPQNASTLLPSDLNHATLHHVTTFVWATSLPTKSELFFSQKKSVLNFSCFFRFWLSFYADFGPLNLAMLYRYCSKVNKKLKVSHTY